LCIENRVRRIFETKSAHEPSDLTQTGINDAGNAPAVGRGCRAAKLRFKKQKPQ
jgi:hypothetical protein